MITETYYQITFFFLPASTWKEAMMMANTARNMKAVRRRIVVEVLVGMVSLMMFFFTSVKYS